MMLKQARGQVLRFVGAKYVLGGKDFCFYYKFKTIFSGHNKLWGSQKFWGECSRMSRPPVLKHTLSFGLFPVSNPSVIE